MAEDGRKDPSLDKQDVQTRTSTSAGELHQVADTLLDQRKSSRKARILRVIWDSFDKTPEERRFISKVDAWIMTYICLAYFVKYLDQTNVSYPWCRNEICTMMMANSFV